MKILESITEDINSIHQVHEDAFGESEGAVVAKLACDVLQAQRGSKCSLTLINLIKGLKNNQRIL